ncbi:MAG: hypothetical protein KBG73_04875 [Candidatus Promineofilum sp.]|nr:hypothetical protein [Promineifilum sp.]
MAVLLIVVVIFLVLLVGMLLAFLFSRADHTVTNTRAAMAAEEKAYNPGVTMGHKIKVQADYEAQLKQAREVAAKRAAALPRGANQRFGRDGESAFAPASQALNQDPQTAVRIARFHGWDGARVGPTTAVATAPAPVAAAPGARPAAPAATAGIAPPQLIAITDSMSPEEVRKARVANAKAESAYNKALKAAASGAPVAPAAAAAVAAPAAVAAGIPAAAGIAPPKLIAITPDMAPEDVRKARVANAKAESAYNKALKAAGVGAGTVAGVETVVNAEMPGPATAVAHPESAAPAAAGVEPPKLITITPDMSPEDVRKARVANAKAESAYNKALKAAGVDPAALRGGPAVVATAVSAPPSTTPASAPAAPVGSAPSTAGTPAAAAGIPAPKLIEITEGMSPEEVRRARVENAKAQSAYNKALKAAGIDPATMK